MIFGEAKVLGRNGLVPARDLRVGQTVWTWENGRWTDAEIRRIEQGAARQAVIVHYHDGVSHHQLRCDSNHPFRLKAGSKLTAKMLQAGDKLMLSEGAHRFYGTVGPIERVDLSEPEPVYGIVLGKRYKTAVVEGFLCHL